MTPIEHARSWLFVPGSRPDRFDKAVAAGPDVVILDLEDAVAAEGKAEARRDVASWLAGGHRAAVRVNAVGGAHHDADLEAVAGLPGVVAVVVPMAESPRALASVHARVGSGVALVPQIETAVGLTRAAELAAAPGVVRLALGHLDLALDLDASPNGGILTHARFAVVVASRAAGRAGPVDSVTPTLEDPSAVHRDARTARALGLTGKLCIHPSQVAAVHEAMSPSAADIVWARRVLDAADTGVARVDGQMVDAPVVARARRLIATGAASAGRADA
ncbi:HpcH/HpaI aldolase/citrate lyase family protein [Nocardioides mangrovi]|uniref:CoA ester lyase n=1 Tax=Nocardioides mangrovi TaxID=2874580 RepID=A0ABS7UG09_9ACTN|nr:CoA ester lyase [Nocardioides mangrovi]MBZ5739573.1 CoA ester lyase [Nocardioides mangrovi]